MDGLGDNHNPSSVPAARAFLFLTVSAALLFGSGLLIASEAGGAAAFRQQIQPILTQFCYDCHGDGMDKGGVSFDTFASDQAMLGSQDLWLRALKMLRADMMPPRKKAQPGQAEKQRVEQWIKSFVFKIDPKDPDPGRVTVRRLNRVEYRNTIRDLMGVDFNTDTEFPADDSGHGFDNIGDVLTLSPMLLEKYLAAAKTVVDQAVPKVSGVPPEQAIAGQAFRPASGTELGEAVGSPRSLSYYEPATVSYTCQIPHSGQYELLLNLHANEKFVDNQFDYNKCRLIFKTDGQELLKQEFARESGKLFQYQFQREWQAGEHVLSFELEPLTPDVKQVRSLSLRINTVTVRGPNSAEHLVPPKNYDQFFGGRVPEDPVQRRQHAGALLEKFATKAFRRPVDSETATRLAALAELSYDQPGKTFEEGVAQAMVAVLTSPRFLFREEEAAPIQAGQTYPYVDEYALATRLSYFLWSSMPDEELFELARENKLRANLSAQVQRMLADPRSEALMQYFPGQWLQARDIESVPINARAVLARERKPDLDLERLRARSRELRDKDPETLTPEEKDELVSLRAQFQRFFGRNRFDLDADLRRAMRRETEMVFDYIVRENRSVLELIDSDYTFLNERLAKHYGIDDVTGEKMRLVRLPADSPRGGVLTEGTVLAVTSNPTRTSPVKRGLFILENILGTPPAPPPPNLPTLDDVAAEIKDHKPTLRETLALHRNKPLCSSCHDRMDPLGLALENFNALGRWREQEQEQPIAVQGQLITGEEFTSIQQLKRILVTSRRQDFYRCVTEKMMTYALGRGVEYYDVEAMDGIVARLEQNEGRFSELLTGIIESAPFQKCRDLTVAKTGSSTEPVN